LKLLILYLDAWPHRYIDVLLKKVREVDPKAGGARLIPVFGYTDCFKVSLLTGLYPGEHNYWVSYVFNDSPRPRPVPKVFSRFLDVDVLPIRGLRFVLSKFTGIHMFHVKTWNNIVEQGMDPESSFVEIDHYLRAKGLRTLFSEFESRSIRYAVLEDRFYRHRLDVFAKAVSEGMERNDVVFAYIDEPDFWGHRYGVEDSQYVALLEWLSDIVKHLIKLAISKGFSYIVFSDHGMATVREYIDLYHYILRDPGYVKTYVAGIDATFFRIFYLRSYRGDSLVLSKIKKLLRNKAFLLREEDFRKYRLPTDRRYGDEVYALREGVVLYPNFFSWLKPRGMHAYSPSYSSQHGIVVAPKDELGDEGADIDVPRLHDLIVRGLS
jgi:hypothetical protein